MKYLCLVYSEEAALEAMPESEFDAFSDEHVALDEELKQSGHSIVAEALQPVHTATTVRVRDGRLLATDGPFAETKEHLLGIYLIEARGPERRHRGGREDPRGAHRQHRGAADLGAPPPRAEGAARVSRTRPSPSTTISQKWSSHGF